MLRAARAVQVEFLDRQGGFIRRELLKGPENSWCDLLYWETREAVEQAQRNAASIPRRSRYFELMAPTGGDDPAAGMLHLEQVESYFSPRPAGASPSPARAGEGDERSRRR
ncbi:MAG: hypothetical protein U1E53_35010 [Dongiaceae bacterium]